MLSAAPRERDALAPWQTEESRGRSGMFLTCWNGARSRIAWVRGRLARIQQCDPSRERGHFGSEGILPSVASRGWDALLGVRASRPREQYDQSPGCAGVLPAYSSMTNHGTKGIVPSAASRGWNALLGARASRPRIAVDPSRERGHRALGCLTRVGRPPGCAGVAPAYSSRPITGARASCPRPPHEGGTPSWVRGRRARVSSVTHHGTRGIVPSVASREQDARRGDWREAPGELGRPMRAGRPHSVANSAEL
jgi:hypothetical protein